MKWGEKLSKSKCQPVQYGLSENDELYCLVKNAQGELSTFWFRKSHGSLADFLAQPGQYSSKFTLIRPVAYPNIWRKYTVIPNGDEQAVYRQVIQILTDELPVPVSELYFDYQTELDRSQNKLELAIFAMVKKVSDEMIINPNTYLDCEIYCYLRGVSHLLNTPKEHLNQHIYTVKNQIVEVKKSGLFISPKSPHSAQPTMDLENIAFDSSVLNRELFIVALGASLWNGKTSA